MISWSTRVNPLDLRTPVVISFIIPAHNEEALIGRTLSALHESARVLGEPYEIIVANDASTDRTGEIAREHGARVVCVNHRQIAATRNAGGREARGDLFFFVDADTIVTRRAVQAGVRALRNGAVGGGCTVHLDGRLPLYAAILQPFTLLFHVVRLAPGCFLFCTRQAYRAAGGFNEAMHWGEEVAFGNRLKRRGRFVILHEFVTTSARKLRAQSALQLIGVAARLALGGVQSRQKGLEYWYGPRKDD
jgi:glycosyltransferase involved in cell wall biosynthesis